MSVDEKKDLVRELSKRPQTAPDKLQSWSRRDIVEILCANLGRERKYIGLSKRRMLDYLFRVVLLANHLAMWCMCMKRSQLSIPMQVTMSTL